MIAPYAEIVGPAARDAMIRTVYGEARGEGAPGEDAVAWVIRNRVEHPAWWGASIYRVCYAPYQFSCHNDNDPNSKICRMLRENDPAYLAIAKIVDGVLASTIPDPTGGATHYKVTGTKASWDKSAAQVAPVIIGRHSFFKLGPHA